MYLCTVETIDIYLKNNKMETTTVETTMTVKMENELFDEMFLTGFRAEHLNMQPNTEFYN